jgi:hypothetical protein
MTIEEKDLKIVYFKPGYYILYVLKNKKELKEDSEDLFRVYGYFTNLDSAFNSAIHFRKNKKYPFKETWKDVLTTYSICITKFYIFAPLNNQGRVP